MRYPGCRTGPRATPRRSSRPRRPSGASYKRRRDSNPRPSAGTAAFSGDLLRYGQTIGRILGFLKPYLACLVPEWYPLIRGTRLYPGAVEPFVQPHRRAGRVASRTSKPSGASAQRRSSGASGPLGRHDGAGGWSVGAAPRATDFLRTCGPMPGRRGDRRGRPRKLAERAEAAERPTTVRDLARDGWTGFARSSSSSPRRFATTRRSCGSRHAISPRLATSEDASSPRSGTGHRGGQDARRLDVPGAAWTPRG